MCGILGSINIEKTHDYLKEISHRGPDAHGDAIFTLDQHEVHLLHHRLSIVDLSEAGKQPMAAFDQKAHIVFNGEIYNHLKIKESLSKISFNGHSDTETILNYFRVNGIREGIAQLNGIFGLAYLDLEKQLLFLARDRFGVKPLYYYFDDDQLLFASEIRPLKAHLQPAIDKGVVLTGQKMRYTPSPFTLYKGISKVAPGQLLTFDLKHKKIRVEKEYYMPYPRLETRKDTEQQLVQEYGDLFEKAVERQLMADVDIGILLSGGVDSALVATIAKQKSSSPVKAFTIGFEGDHSDLDETAYAQETAEVIGLQHYTKKIGFSDFLSTIEKAVKIVEEPIGTTSIIPMYFLASLASSHVKVVLSGQGADEPLGGYSKYRALHKLEMARNLRTLGPLIKNLDFAYKNKEYVRRFVDAVLPRNKVASWLAFNSVSSNQELTNLLVPSLANVGVEELKAIQQKVLGDWGPRVPANESLQNLFPYLDMHTSLSDDLLMYTDKLTMNFGLECRVPILDNDLITFIQSLKNSLKFNSKEGKLIHKAFAREYLPSKIINRRKLDFKSPTETWFREKTGELEDVFSKANEFKKLFNIEKVKLLLRNHKEGKNMEKQIFLLLSLNYLLANEV